MWERKGEGSPRWLAASSARLGWLTPGQNEAETGKELLPGVPLPPSPLFFLLALQDREFVIE